MREVTFKHLTKAASRKKDIFLKEVFEKDGVIAKTERRCFYFIKGMTDFDEGKDLKNWIKSPDKTVPISKRHFHILKERNDELSEDRLICKVAGTFYAIVDRKLFTIAFLHSFKVSFIKSSCVK